MLDKGVDRRPVSRPGFVSRLVTSIVRLVLPVLVLCGTFALAFCLRDKPVPELAVLARLDPQLDPTSWLNWGLLILPLVFLVLNLTSRRYGPALTLTSALLSWLVIGAAIIWAVRDGLIGDFEAQVAPYAVAASFVGAMAVAQLVNILLFDWLRGIPWWKAPLFAAFAGGLVFSIVFNTRPAIVWDQALGMRLVVEAAIQLSWAVAQLLPTWALRRTIRPLPGFGGA